MKYEQLQNTFTPEKTKKMGHEKTVKKESKKAPTKTLKEKRAEKKAKKASRT